MGGSRVLTSLGKAVAGRRLPGGYGSPRVQPAPSGTEDFPGTRALVCWSREGPGHTAQLVPLVGSG